MRSIPRRVCSVPALLTFLLSALGLLLCGAATARAQGAGLPGPSTAGALSVPTGSKPESKLWWNDGRWWGCLWSADAQAFTIHALVVPTRTWVDTGVAVDVRPKSRADCLWNGRKLYIASHQYTDGLGAPGYPLELFRYSYDPRRRRYSLDVGFPTLMADVKSETAVIDQDSTGTLWAVWTAGYRVWIAHSQGDDRSWSVAGVHPLSTSDLTEDDIASVVSFGGDRIGVLWSDQVSNAFLFTSHRDGEPAGVWTSPETVLAGPLIEDDICLRAARDGRIFAALSTHTPDVRLAVRSPEGIWSSHVVATDADDWNHPILLLDEEARTVHLFGTAPAAFGAIYEKSASLDALAFAAGRGTAVIRDPNRAAICQATSTKQAVRGATGLVVLASHQELELYAYHRNALGGPRSAPPVAAFHADQGEGFEPVAVTFLDASTGQPTQWAWDFGDGATSLQRNPVHTYARAGSYTVSLRVANALGSDLVTKTDLVRVETPPALLVLRAIADGTTYEGRPDDNIGGLATLRARGGRDPDYRSFLRFFVPPSQAHVASAVVRLGCIDASTGDSGELFRVDGDWSEPTLTWNTMPALGPSVGSLAEAVTGSSIDVDVSAAVTGSGTASFAIASTSFHSVYYSSREGGAPPELHVALSQAASARAVSQFEANRLDGSAPLTVQFRDTSNGRVDSWRWDFGDGGSADVQNPSHTFRRPGLYAVALTVTNSSGEFTQVGADVVYVRARVPTPREQR